MTRRRYTGLDPAHEDAEPIVLYLDDPEGPETFEEAVQAFHDSLVDLWEITGLPVAEKAVAKLQAGVEAWRDWWKPMDLSGHWTKGWTREETLGAMIRRLLIDPWAEVFRRAYVGNRTAPELRGIQGMSPRLVVRDEVAPFSIGLQAGQGLTGSFGLSSLHHRDLVAQAAAIEVLKHKAGRVGLDWDDIVRRAREDPRDGTEAEAIRRAYEAAMDDGIREGTIPTYEPRGFLDAFSGEWMEDDE